MKILHITPTFEPKIGGIENVISNLVRQSVRNGIVADVLHVEPGMRYEKEYNQYGTITWRRPVYGHRLIGLIPSMRKIASGYDILHVHDPQTAAISLNLALFCQGKIKIFSTHGGFFHNSKDSIAKKLYWSAITPLMLKQYSYVLASSSSDALTFQKRNDKTQLAANGVDVERYLSIHRDNQTSLRRWLYWGRISDNKRIHLTINLVAKLKRRGVDVSLIIAGPDFDGLVPYLEDIIKQEGVADRITIRSELDDAELLKTIVDQNVYITASAYEGFGLTVIEALAAGLVVVANDISPLNNFVRTGENGLLIDFNGTETELAAIESFVASSPEKVQAMTLAARASARSFDWNRSFKTFLDVYNNLALKI
ncbi:glycosyltransferase family 4 protein [Oryzifoliimicrobium ureilyticus]|uniref:glycosyltransferase family 4 protein n=1 Tax=Oryzifoliimicrobium ureilyticus TaxID=3113724 RepID=UPI003075FBC3